MRRRCVLALFASAWLFAEQDAAADGPHRVGVVVGVRVNVAEARAEAIAKAFEQALARELDVEVVSASGPAIERDLSPGCATDPVCLAGLTARIEVDELLFMVVVGAGDRVRVEFSRRDAVTGELTHPPALVLDPDAEAMRPHIARVVAQLLPGASPRAAQRPDAPPAPAPAPAPVPAVASIDRDPDSAGAGKRTAGVIVATTGLALLGGSIALALRSRSAADRLRDRHPQDDLGVWTAKDQSLEDAHYRDRTWAVVLGIGAGVALAGDAALYVLGVRERRRAGEPSVALDLERDGGAVTWRVSF